MSFKMFNWKTFQIIILLFFSLTPIIWFIGKWGDLINGVDTNFPLDPWIWLTRRFYAWSSVSNGGLPMSSNVSGILFHTVQSIPYLLGANLQLVELISLIFWFSVLVVSAYLFARLIVKERISQVVFVCLYVFNIYLFNTWENIKVSNIALVIGIPLFLSILIASERKSLSINKLIFYTAISATLVTGSGINPAYFITMILGLLIWVLIRCFFKDNLNLKDYLNNFLVMLLVIFLVNTFWILPTLQYLFFSGQSTTSLTSFGFTDWVSSLSQNTSLLNIFRQQGAWDWYAFDDTGTPLYIPYAINYFNKFPFLIFSFTLTALAISSFIFRKKNYTYPIFGVFLSLGLFLGAGTHDPTGIFFNFLSKHLPFFTFFRSPWYIFTPFLILAVAALVSLWFENLVLLFQKSRYLKFIKLGIVLFILANIIYCYPLITGKIFRPSLTNGFYVKFPNYVFQAKEYLNKLYQSNPTRIIGYPGGDTEQFNWGYRGEESILELFSPFDVLFSPLNNTGSSVALMVQDFYEDINLGELEGAKRLANKLDTGIIFDKGDQLNVEQNLSSQITTLPHNQFGPWSFYHFDDPKKIYSVVDLIETDLENPNSVSVNDLLEPKDALVNENDSVVRKIPGISSFSGNIILAENSQNKDLNIFQSQFQGSGFLNRDLSKVDFTFNIKQQGTYQFILNRYKLEQFGIDPNKKLDAKFDNTAISLNPEDMSDSYVYFTPINLNQGNHVLELNLINENLISDLSNFKQSGNGEFDLIQDNSGKYLSIYNSSNRDISAVYNVSNFDPLVPYLINVSYKQVYGNYAQILAIQFKDSIFYRDQAQTMPNYPDWKRYSFYFVPYKAKSSLQILLNSPFYKDPLGTTIDYANLSVQKVFNNNLYLVKSSQQTLSSPEINFIKDSPVEYSGQVKNGGLPHILVFSENYSPDWKLTISDPYHKTLKLTPLHFSVNSYANAWYIEGAPDSYQFNIYYSPQQTLNLGFIISGATLLLAGALKWKK